jgi:50S ribosomal protein L16 3-hydroxylase
MTAPLGELTPEEFLRDYWQKKPCLIRQAMPGFSPPLDADDLAGLAMEEMAESRLVTGTMEASDWRLVHGPFSEKDFSALPEEGWTLLVQDVEKHYAPLQSLLSLFDFLPSWRIDDLMVSYAVKGGSVGPHTDQYDVFLYQAEGQRRWQIAEAFNPALLADCPLNVLESFTPEQEWVLDAGDMLYLPPNIAHHGVALEPGMTWSIGARAPSGTDLLQAYGEWLAYAGDEGGRYRDPDRRVAGRPGEIEPAALAELKQFMHQAIGTGDHLDAFLAQFLSRFRQAHEPAPPPGTIDLESLTRMNRDGLTLMKNPWTRLAWVARNDEALLFASGDAFNCSISLAVALCGQQKAHIAINQLDKNSLQTVRGLINGGHFILA